MRTMSIEQSMSKSHGKSRRGFLKTVGAASTVVGLAGCAGSSNTVELKLSGCHPEEDTNMGAYQNTFAEIVESESDSIEIANFYDGELGGTVEVIESVSAGNIDMNACHHFPGAASTLGIPEMAFFSGPFVFEDYEEAMIATDPENSDFARDIHDRNIEEADTRILTSLAFGTRCFSMADQQVTSPDDLDGARIRGPDGDLMAAVIRGLGGDPVLIDWSETPQALSTGVADGVEQILWALEVEPITESTNQLILTRHMSEVIGLTINEGIFQDLNDEQQQVLQDSAIEARDTELEAALERDQGRIDTISDAGLEIIDEDAGLDREAFRESVNNEVESQFPEWAEIREKLTEPLA